MHSDQHSTALRRPSRTGLTLPPTCSVAALLCVRFASIKRKHQRILVTGGAGFIGSHLIER